MAIQNQAEDKMFIELMINGSNLGAFWQYYYQ